MSRAIHWFRRDLRLEDNAALYHALKSGKQVQCIFIFDRQILDRLDDNKDARVTFIHQELTRLNKELQDLGSSLKTYYGNPIDLWPEIARELKPEAVFANRDYEPYAKERDEQVSKLLSDQNIHFNTYKDHVIFEMDEVLKDDGTPYVVYTPYSRKWKSLLTDFHLKPYLTKDYVDNLLKCEPKPIITLPAMGFESSDIAFPGKSTTLGIIKNYEAQRNFPAIEGTSRLSVHFRFGTISIRDKAAKGQKTSEKWLDELIWRDFYAHILHHFPHVVGNAFKPQYDQIKWSKNEKHYEAWCQGKTGYGLVDAGMRELFATGFMHNRVRMVVASFLTKHLLLDWRWGEAYFAKKLLDYELASNNGGWQWAAGSGVDAAPYFRIFNPYTQIEKFDKQHKYIKKWIPEWGTPRYPKEIVEHKAARELCLATYKEGLNQT
ncbi:MAG: deoxyribodipyrimidine photo-lyase [Bacteroidia bacterium]